MHILYLTHNRLEFTVATFRALFQNTNWSLVKELHVYDDNSRDGTRQYLEAVIPGVPCKTLFYPGRYGSPVMAMLHFILSLPHEGMMAKIDNDTMVPPKWLENCLQVMNTNTELDLLGIESHDKVQSGQLRIERSYTPAQFIGGIGLFRLRAFRTLPRPTGYFGFTAWQQLSQWVNCGWISPSLPVFLMDRYPFEPWLTYSSKYVEHKWQRPWPCYDPNAHFDLWEWWGNESVERALEEIRVFRFRTQGYKVPD